MAIYRFRYQIYVAEMQRIQYYANHVERTIVEPLDSTAHLLTALQDGNIVGTLRINFARDGDLGYYNQLYRLADVDGAYPQQVAITTKLMVHPSLRGGTLGLQVAAAAYAFGALNGIRFDHMDCNPHLEAFFRRIGYVPHCDRVQHVEYGDVQPMRLDLFDHTHLQAVRSPFLWLLGRKFFETTIMEKSINHSYGPSCAPAPAGDIIDVLDRRIQKSVAEIEASEFWIELTSPRTDPELLRLAVKEIYLEITSYQPHVIEAAIATIGQMPRSMPVRMMKAMLRHQAEEFDHGEMAMRDYVAVGGEEHYARNVHRISPASFAVASVWWMIAHQRDPFGYLGSLYPFEGLTPLVSAKAIQILSARGFPANALEFFKFHSEEDPKHTELVRHLIRETVERYPESERAILEGIERFLAVYPLPVWNTAFERAKRAHKQTTAA